MLLLLFLCGAGAILLQMIVPKLPLVEIHPFLVALPVLYAAMRLKGGGPLALALGLGLVIDLLSPQKLGTGGFVLCLVVGIAWSQRENLPFDHWGSVAFLALVATFGALIADYALFCWESGTRDWRFILWVRLAWVAVLNAVLAVPFFVLCDLFLSLRRRGDEEDYAL
ncbi:MAG: rod shape-determining protein MreD [Verrucomicrobium sp.]|nr:rod shape-determining protein MreD [Verrucomicrobium sp.]